MVKNNLDTTFKYDSFFSILYPSQCSGAGTWAGSHGDLKFSHPGGQTLVKTKLRA